MAKECYRVQVGLGLGLTSKCMSKQEAERIAKFIDQGGMRVWVVKGKRRK